MKFYKLTDGRIAFVGRSKSGEWVTYYARQGENPNRKGTPRVPGSPTRESSEGLLETMVRAHAGKFKDATEIPFSCIEESYKFIMIKIAKDLKVK